MKEFEKLLDELVSVARWIEYNYTEEGNKTGDNAVNKAKEIKAKLVAMHQATGESSDGWHLWPRRAMTRDGKAVWDVPNHMEHVLVYAVNSWLTGYFRKDGNGICVFGGGWVRWENVFCWYSLPAITTDADGNMELPF